MLKNRKPLTEDQKKARVILGDMLIRGTVVFIVPLIIARISGVVLGKLVFNEGYMKKLADYADK